MAARQAYVEEEDEEDFELDVSSSHNNHSSLHLPFLHRANGSLPSRPLKSNTQIKSQLADSIIHTRRATTARTGRARARVPLPMASPSKISVGSPSGSSSEQFSDEDTAIIDNSEAQSALRAQFERKRAEAAVIVPTDDKHVRARLRSLGHPITLFGEDKATRRDRLRSVLFELQQEGKADDDVSMKDASEKLEPSQETYYHAGEALLKARRDITRYSNPRSLARLAFQKAESKIKPRRHLPFRKEIKDRVGEIDIWGSQQPFERPIAAVRFAPDSKTIAASSRGGDLKLIDIPSLEQRHTFRGHSDVVGGLAWNTDATAFDNASGLQLASGDGDGRILLWSASSSAPVAELKNPELGSRAHEARVAHLEFHPSGHYLASASHDTTWALWDLTTGSQLLVQEGHSEACHTVAWNIDGNLIASGGFDAIGRVWDVRSGKIVMYLDSHIDNVYALDWGTDGHRVLSGGADGFVKAWDLRVVREVASMGGHSNGVADLRWYKGTDGPLAVEELGTDGEGYVPKRSATVFVTGGMDSNVCLWSADDWRLVKTLKAHERTVTSVDWSVDGKWVVSGSLDKTVKVWAREDGEPF